ncbi:MAG: GNAT family N-acetyltransferase [Alphaproteobacteria bacterium]|jgi:predicted N-acyltransferase
MPDGEGAVTARIIEHIADVPSADWDALAGDDNPFVSHGFLNALEVTGCATGRTGWLPQHMIMEDSAGRLIGAVPLYLKNHSQGEYVFDHGWAHAFERAGGDYYPKLQASVPFSPVTGPRLLAGAGAGTLEIQFAMARTLETFCERMNISSVHVTFPTRGEWQVLGEAGWIQRRGRQFHWHNRGYESFDDFLGALMSRKRKSIRKERREVAEAGITVRALTGDEIEPRHWDAFYRFYIDTYDRKWGYPYLTREFFQVLQDTLPDKVVLVIAEHDGRPVAGAINLKGKHALYGRNWGCIEDHRFLHFECCYYQAIEFAIAHGLDTVEAGTQGPHKIQRGYLPTETYSAHFVRHAGLRDAIERFCEEESREVDYEIMAYGDHSPYRQDGTDAA